MRYATVKQRKENKFVEIRLSNTTKLCFQSMDPEIRAKDVDEFNKER